jgi:hypothetical protein
MFDKKTKDLIEKKNQIRYSLVKMTNEIYIKQCEIAELKKRINAQKPEYFLLQEEIAKILSTYDI